MRQFIISLKGWSEVLDHSESDDKRRQIVFEFVTPIATLAINLPYVIRSRFIYSVVHLCHQANRIKQPEWIDYLPPDDDIYFKYADQYANDWKKYQKLKFSLEKIATKKKPVLNF